MPTNPGGPDPWKINVDLHCHSTFSDGMLSPQAVVRRAHGNGVRVLALTDHDETGGLDEAAETAAALGMSFVPGVEISVTWADTTIHVVGLKINPNDPTLLAGLAALRQGRDGRARAMGESLAAAGVANAFEGALAFVGNPALISRTHFARFLVQEGYCESTHQVFQRYLVEGKPGYAAHRWTSLREAMHWIQQAGGVAVLAHPGRYRLDQVGLWALLEEFREAGGQAIEVITGSHTRDQYQRFARLALEFDFRASRGSDFHSPEESRVDLGELPDLPDSVVPLWHDWIDVLAHN